LLFSSKSLFEATFPLLKMSRHTLSNYHLALMKIYGAFVEGGKLSVINNNKQQPIG
jgi:hypothetical protein